MRQGKLLARAQLLSSGVLFGLMAVLARLGSRAGASFTPMQIATVRFAIGTAMIVGVFRARPGTFRPVRHRLLVTRGVVGGVAALLYFVALGHIPAGEATLLSYTYPVMATALSLFTIGERPTFHLALALLVTSAGVLLVVGPGAGGFSLGVGELAALGSAFLSAIAVTSIRALRATDNAPTIFFAFCVGGLAFSAPLAASSAWPSSPAAWGIALAVAGVSFFAQLLMTQAYGALTVPEAAVWQQVTPVAAYLWALLLLDERLSGAGELGIVLGVLGIAYSSVFGGRAGADHPPRTAAQRVDPA